jgi:hypothetical protein
MQHRTVFSENAQNYLTYMKLSTALFLDSFVTIFFVLWLLAVDVLGRELMASKFLHVICPLVISHWWILSRYPLHQMNVMIEGYASKGDVASISAAASVLQRASESDWVELKIRHDKMMWKTLIKSVLVYVIVFLVDVLFLSIKLIPIAVTCANNWNNGEKVPVECGGWNENLNSFGLGGGLKSGNKGSEQEYQTDSVWLYWLTLAMAVLQIFVDVYVIVIVGMCMANKLEFLHEKE